MIFKGSNFEERYNSVWNSYAVSADSRLNRLLNAKGLFSPQPSNFLEYLNQYKNGAITIVENLQRQAEMFEDQDYIKEYLNATIANTKDDFQNYRTALSRLYGEGSACVIFIDETIKWLNSCNSDLVAVTDDIIVSTDPWASTSVGEVGVDRGFEADSWDMQPLNPLSDEDMEILHEYFGYTNS